jgi:chemosensory pili system protein ChpA (sensor histidine kinase/response regulator)
MDDKRKYVQVHGKLLPYVELEKILNYSDLDDDLPEKRTVLILHDAGISVAMGIGEITGRQEIVIKTLGSQIQNIEYIAGGTILADGEVAIILDYAAVIRLVEYQFFGNVRVNHTVARTEAETELHIDTSEPALQKYIAKKVVTGRKPRILVVDDSSSVRTFVGSVLEKQDYATIRASDGEQAFEIIEKEIIDLVITDLEMPAMDGFDLIQKIRAEEKYDDIPIVILTGRSGQKQRERGESLGANSFIGKPFKESDLLRVVADFIEMVHVSE